MLPGIFLDFELIAGGIWKGDILIAGLEDLEKLDASNICKDRGYSYVWASGQEPRLTQMGKASSARQTISYRTFQRIWHHPLRDWDLISQRQPGQRNIKSESLNTSTQSPHFQSRSGKLNHTGRTYSHGGMMDYPKIPFYGMEYWKNSWFSGISKLENQLHNWGLLTNSRSSCHRALDQRSWDCLNWRTCDIAGHPNFPDFDMIGAMIASALKKHLTHVHFRNRVGVEEQRGQNCRPILSRKTNCAHASRAFQCNRSVWSGTRTLNSVPKKFTEWRRPRFRRQMGSCFLICEWNALRYDQDCTSQNWKVLLNIRLWWHCVIKKLLEIIWHRTVNNSRQL